VPQGLSEDISFFIGHQLQDSENQGLGEEEDTFGRSIPWLIPGEITGISSQASDEMLENMLEDMLARRKARGTAREIARGTARAERPAPCM
jgi:hypothetical protein